MIQRYNDYSHDLAWLAIEKCFENKWSRNDVLTFIEEWAGISRRELWRGELAHDYRSRYEAIDSLAYVMDDVIDGIMRGVYPDLDEVKIRERPDGMTNKMRKIAYLCIMHQLLGHIVKMGLDPLLHARLLPTQHASIPEHGQTQLARQVRRYLRKHKLDVKCFQKTDCTNAYGSLMYDAVIQIIAREIPRARWLLATLRFLATCAPGGHLIIGGYLDAWLFNFAMSYAMRATMAQGKTRRGKFMPYIVRIEAFMDDMALMGKTPTGIKRAVAYLIQWMQDNLCMAVRTTTGIISWLTVERERANRSRASPAGRGCPCLDMGGYRICRTHTTMRRRVVKRVIRSFSRAWTEYKRTGSLRRVRAGSIIARHGPEHFSDSENFRKKYHAAELVKAAKRVGAYWQRAEARKRKEYLYHAVYECAGKCAPGARAAGAPA